MINVLRLTIDDKQKNEMQKEVFVLIRLIDMIEKCVQLTFDRISPEEHCTQVKKLLEKYEQFKSKIPGFELNKFVQEYNLDECKFGLDRIRQGPPKNIDQRANKLLVRLTTKFVQFSDSFLDPNLHRVSKFKPLLEELIELLEQAQNQMPPYTSYLKELQDYNNRVFKQKQFMDVLSEDEVKELEAIFDQAHQNFLKVNY